MSEYLPGTSIPLAAILAERQAALGAQLAAADAKRHRRRDLLLLRSGPGIVVLPPAPLSPELDKAP